MEINVLLRACAMLALCLGFTPLSSHAWDTEYPRSGLLDLSAQAYPVNVPPKIRATPLPASVDARLSTDSEHVQYGLMPLHRLLPYGYGTVWSDEPQWADGSAISTPLRAMPPVATTGVDDWSLGARNWRYESSLGYGVTVGNTATPAPAWHRGDPARLAGVGLYTTQPGDDRMGRKWRYAATAGALVGDGDSNAANGGLDYGPVAYDVAASYAADPNLSIASRAQGTVGLLTLGLGGKYAMGDWGSWALGVSRATQSGGSGWGYQLGYQLDLPDDWDVSWANIGRSSGYHDLSSYNADVGCGCVGNQWQLSMPMGRWGTLSGTYEQWDRALGGLERKVGLAQDFWYGPFLSVSLGFNRNLLSGDYGLGAKFSVSLD